MTVVVTTRLLSYLAKGVLAYASIVISACADAQTVDWTKIENRTATSSDIATAFEVSPGGLSVIGGISSIDITYFVAYNDTGSKLWSATYDDPTTSAMCEPVAIAIGSTYAYAACKVYPPVGIPYPMSPILPAIRLIRLRLSDGDVTAGSLYNYSGYPTSPVDIAMSSSGSPYVTGTANVPSAGTDIITCRFNSTGTSALWEESYAGTGNAAGYDDYPISIAIDSDGNVMVSAHTRGTSGDSQHMTVLRYKYSTSITPPRLIWDERYHDYEFYKSGGKNAWFYNDAMYVAGSSRSNSITLYEINAIGYTKGGGSALDRLCIGGNFVTPSNDDDGTMGVVANSTGVFVYGQLKWYPFSSPSYKYIIYDATNDSIYDDPLPNLNEPKFAANDTEFALSGEDVGGVYTKKYPAGWTNTFNNGYGANEFVGTGMDSDGAVYVAGYTATASTGLDFFVRKYDP